MTTMTRPTATEPVTIDDLASRLHLWMIPLAGTLDATWVRDNRSILSADEAARCDRYLRPADADMFLASHAVVRRILSKYCDVSPTDWRFQTNAHGRPEAVNAGAPAGLRFNLTHTPGLTAVLVHDRCASGVDAELIGRVADPTAMSRTVFAGSEREELLGLAPDAQASAFCRLWTLKESFIKAKGMGLAIPLKDFAFSGFAQDQHITMQCEPAVDADPAGWDFTSRTVNDHHVVATATHRGAGDAKPVHVIDADVAAL